jgi:hypothetical protein
MVAHRGRAIEQRDRLAHRLAEEERHTGHQAADEEEVFHAGAAE